MHRTGIGVDTKIVLIEAEALDVVLVSVNGHLIYYDDFSERNFHNENVTAFMIAERLGKALGVAKQDVTLTEGEVEGFLGAKRFEEWNVLDLHNVGLDKLGLKSFEPWSWQPGVPNAEAI